MKGPFWGFGQSTDQGNRDSANGQATRALYNPGAGGGGRGVECECGPEAVQCTACTIRSGTPQCNSLRMPEPDVRKS